MRLTKFIKISEIIVDNYSISKQTLDLAMKIKNKEIDIADITPIKLQNLGNGKYKL